MLKGDETSVSISDDPLFVDKGWVMCEEEAPVHERCTLECADGHYWVSGDFSRQCQANSLWNGVDLVCGKYCPDLVSGENVDVSGTCTSAREGEVCEQVCANEYYESPSGATSSTRTCQSDGTWSNAMLECTKPVPTCDEDLDATAASREAETVSGSSCSGGTLPSGLKGVLRGKSCVQKCAVAGAHIKLSGDFTRICQENGTWTGSPLVCPESIPCEEDLEASADARNVSSYYEDMCSAPAAPGTMCTQWCKDSKLWYHASGDINVACSINGVWAGGSGIGNYITCAPVTPCKPRDGESAASKTYSHLYTNAMENC